MIPRGQELEGELAARPEGAVAGRKVVSQVRAGLGLLGASQLSPPVLAAEPGAPAQLQHGLGSAAAWAGALESRLRAVDVQHAVLAERHRIQFREDHLESIEAQQSSRAVANPITPPPTTRAETRRGSESGSRLGRRPSMNIRLMLPAPWTTTAWNLDIAARATMETPQEDGPDGDR